MTTQIPGLPQLPEEARADVSDLERYDDALATEDPLTGDPFSPIVAPEDDLQRDIREGSGEPRALEDLYAEHPDIGGGSKFLRVVRKAPRNWAGMNIAGFVTDLHEQLSMEAFAARFGGGDYVVAVMGAGGGTLEPDGSQRVRTIHSMRLGLSGPPKLLSGQEPPPITGRVGMNDPSATVRITELQIAERERQRADQAQREASAALARSKSIGPDVIKNLDEIASSRALQMQGAYTQQIAQQQRTIERLELQRNRLEEEIQEERRKSAEAERKWTSYGMQAEQEAEKRLKENHEAALKRVTEEADRRVKEANDERTRRIEELQRDHGKRLEDLAKEHSSRMDQLRTSQEKEIKDLNERNSEERKRLETHAQDEKKLVREDAERREKQVANDTMVRENTHRQDAESRLRDMERLHTREVQSLKEAHARELLSIQMNADTKAITATAMADGKVTIAEQERSRMKSELDQLRRENAELRAQAHKPPLQAISEAHALAEMTGMIKSSDVEGKEPEGEFDWKKGLFTFLNGAIAKVPEALKSMEEARQANQAAARMAQGAPGQPMQHVQGPDGRYYVVQPPPQAAQAASAGRRVRRVPPMPGFGSMPPPWGQGAGPVEPGANPYVPPVGPPAPVSAGVPPPFPWGSQAPPRDAAAPPASGREPGTSRAFVPFEGPPAEPPVASYAPAVEAGPEEAPSPTPPPHAGPGSAAVPGVTLEQVKAFADNLEMAVQTGAVSPEQFAQQFVGQVGPEGTRVILSSLTPDQLVDQIAQSKDGASTALATQDGRTYLRELWAAAGRLVGMAG